MNSFACLAAGLAASFATAGSSHSPSVKIFHPWIATPPGGAPTAAAYLTIRNTGKTPEVLLNATTSVAQTMQLHASSMTGGVMSMRPIAGGVTIGPGQGLTLAPGGYHFMLMHLKHALKAGDRAPAVLTFAKAGAVQVMFIVQAAPVSGMAMP